MLNGNRLVVCAVLFSVIIIGPALVVQADYPYLEIKDHQIVKVDGSPGNESYQPVRISGIGMYNEIENEELMDEDADIAKGIKNMADHNIRLLRTWATSNSHDHLTNPINPWENIGDKYQMIPLHWNSSWATRLSAILNAASNPDEDNDPENENEVYQNEVIVFIGLFDTVGLDGGNFSTSPWNPANNNLGIPIPALSQEFIYDICDQGPYPNSPEGVLYNAEKTYVKYVVNLTKNYWNVIYEVMNEPEGAPIALIEQWHQTVVGWINEELGNDNPHLIALCNHGDNNGTEENKELLDQTLLNTGLFQILSMHGAAGGWQDKVNGTPTPWDPCTGNDAYNKYLAYNSEYSNITNKLNGSQLHIIVDTDGLHGSDISPRDFDVNCYDWMNIALSLNQSFDSKEIVHNLINESEKDCNDNGPDD